NTEQMRQAAFVLDHAVILSVIAIPLIALVMRLFFIGLKLRYVDALVLLCYTQGQASLFGIVSGLAPALGAPIMVGAAASGFALVCFLWAWATAATGPWWRRLLSAFLTLIVGEALNTALILAVLHFA